MRVRTPHQERSKETRNKILKTALRLFAEKGFYHTNSKEIAKEAQIATGSFYAYFKNKKDLFIEVLKMYYQMTEAGLFERQGDLANYGKKEFIYEFIQKTFRAHDLYPEFDREITVMSYTDEDVRKIITAYRKELLEKFVLLIQDFSDQLRVNDMRAAAFIVGTMMENFVHRVRFSYNEITEDRLIKELADITYRYLFKA